MHTHTHMETSGWFERDCSVLLASIHSGLFRIASCSVHTEHTHTLYTHKRSLDGIEGQFHGRSRTQCSKCVERDISSFYLRFFSLLSFTQRAFHTQTHTYISTQQELFFSCTVCAEQLVHCVVSISVFAILHVTIMSSFSNIIFNLNYMYLSDVVELTHIGVDIERVQIILGA